MCIRDSNGAQLPTPLTYEQMVYYYTKSYPRVILQEQFGTERSRITPYAQTDLNYALPGYEEDVYKRQACGRRTDCASEYPGESGESYG